MYEISNSIKNSLKILFDWENLTLEELKNLTKDMSLKNIRYLAMTHPDNKTRENLFRISNVLIGEKTVLNYGLCIIDNYKKGLVKIGRRCAIASNVTLVASSNPNMSKLSERQQIKNKYIKEEPIIIDDDVWLGANVIILPGISIGNESIIGAGSIITKSIPPKSIVRNINGYGQVVDKIND